MRCWRCVASAWRRQSESCCLHGLVHNVVHEVGYIWLGSYCMLQVGLIMLELHPSSLLLVAVWGLLDGALSVLCGAAVGAWVDRQPRLVAASRMYLLQNSCVALSAATALALLWSSVRTGAAYWAGLALTMAAGSVSTLGALGSTLSGALRCRALGVQTATRLLLCPHPGLRFWPQQQPCSPSRRRYTLPLMRACPPPSHPTLPTAVEREWTKALCGGDSHALAALNAGMKRIDLTCLIASPILGIGCTRLPGRCCCCRLTCLRQPDAACCATSPECHRSRLLLLLQWAS